MKILSHRQDVEVTFYRRSFIDRSHQSSGFSFPCDKDGNLLLNEMYPPGIQNYKNCLDNPIEFKDEGIQEFHSRYTQPAIGLCDCGCQVELDGFTNTCECGADYNWAGQRLATRDQWSDDTGESLSDILNIP